MVDPKNLKEQVVENTKKLEDIDSDSEQVAKNSFEILKLKTENLKQNVRISGNEDKIVSLKEFDQKLYQLILGGAKHALYNATNNILPQNVITDIVLTEVSNNFYNLYFEDNAIMVRENISNVTINWTLLRNDQTEVELYIFEDNNVIKLLRLITSESVSTIINLNDDKSYRFRVLAKDQDVTVNSLQLSFAGIDNTVNLELTSSNVFDDFEINPTKGINPWYTELNTLSNNYDNIQVTVSDNVDDILSLTEDITEITENITDNTNNIATNTTNIATNAANIITLTNLVTEYLTTIFFVETKETTITEDLTYFSFETPEVNGYDFKFVDDKTIIGQDTDILNIVMSFPITLSTEEYRGFGLYSADTNGLIIGFTEEGDGVYSLSHAFKEGENYSIGMVARDGELNLTGNLTIEALKYEGSASSTIIDDSEKNPQSGINVKLNQIGDKLDSSYGEVELIYTNLSFTVLIDSQATHFKVTGDYISYEKAGWIPSEDYHLIRKDFLDVNLDYISTFTLDLDSRVTSLENSSGSSGSPGSSETWETIYTWEEGTPVENMIKISQDYKKILVRTNIAIGYIENTDILKNGPWAIDQFFYIGESVSLKYDESDFILYTTDIIYLVMGVK